jgi:predicted DNA-binding ribbon-helix-helix protein
MFIECYLNVYGMFTEFSLSAQFWSEQEELYARQQMMNVT